MITPKFTLSQDDKHLIARIELPLVRSEDIDVHFVENDFKVYAKPYLLQLTLPGQVFESGDETGSYDVESGILVVHAPKMNPGEHFPDLDLVTRFMPTKIETAGTAAASGKPLIEVISSTSTPSGANGEREPDSDDESSEEGGPAGEGMDAAPTAPDHVIDWHDTTVTEPRTFRPGDHPYGFNNQYTDFFSAFHEELYNIISLPDPTIAPEQRRAQRLCSEDAKWDSDHYMADFIEEKEMLGELMEYDMQTLIDTGDLTSDEQNTLRQLPNKSYLVDSPKSVLLSLVDILFAYAYDARTTLGDATVESPWTICNISATLSWLDTFTSLQDAVVAGYRRALSFPLYRNLRLCHQVRGDVGTILSGGRRSVIKHLLRLKAILDGHESYYLLSRLYINDYLTWLQQCDAKVIEGQLSRLGNEVIELSMAKTCPGLEPWRLAAIEDEAREEYDF